MPNIAKPGFYFDISDAVYHADPVVEPSLSSTVARILYDQTPLHAAYAHPRINKDFEAETKRDRAVEMGSAIHKIMLGKGRKVDTLPFDDYKKKEAQQMREDSYAAGNIPVLQSDMANVALLNEAATTQLVALGRGDIFQKCHTEVTMIWQEKNGVWCRARLDALPKDAGDVAHIKLPELKSTGGSADVETYTGRYFEMGYDVQVAFYKRGLKALLPNVRSIEFEWVVMEQKPPCAVNILTLSNQAGQEADDIASLAIDTWGACLKAGKWPGYTGTDIVETTQWRSMKREMRNSALLQQMSDWQRPL